MLLGRGFGFFIHAFRLAGIAVVCTATRGYGRPMITGHSHQTRTMGQFELVVMVALVMSLNALAIDGMLPALDDMARELGAEQGNRRQLVVAVFLIANGVGCLVPGSFADRFGRRPLLLFALGVYVVFSGLISQVPRLRHPAGATRAAGAARLGPRGGADGDHPRPVRRRQDGAADEPGQRRVHRRAGDISHPQLSMKQPMQGWRDGESSTLKGIARGSRRFACGVS